MSAHKEFVLSKAELPGGELLRPLRSPDENHRLATGAQLTKSFSSGSSLVPERSVLHSIDGQDVFRLPFESILSRLKSASSATFTYSPKTSKQKERKKLLKGQRKENDEFISVSFRSEVVQPSETESSDSDEETGDFRLKHSTRKGAIENTQHGKNWLEEKAELLRLVDELKVERQQLKTVVGDQQNKIMALISSKPSTKDFVLEESAMRTQDEDTARMRSEITALKEELYQARKALEELRTWSLGQSSEEQLGQVWNESKDQQRVRWQELCRSRLLFQREVEMLRRSLGREQDNAAHWKRKVEAIETVHASSKPVSTTLATSAEGSAEELKDQVSRLESELLVMKSNNTALSAAKTFFERQTNMLRSALEKTTDSSKETTFNTRKSSTAEEEKANSEDVRELKRLCARRSTELVELREASEAKVKEMEEKHAKQLRAEMKRLSEQHSEQMQNLIKSLEERTGKKGMEELFQKQLDEKLREQRQQSTLQVQNLVQSLEKGYHDRLVAAEEALSRQRALLAKQKEELEQAKRKRDEMEKEMRKVEENNAALENKTRELDMAKTAQERDRLMVIMDNQTLKERIMEGNKRVEQLEADKRAMQNDAAKLHEELAHVKSQIKQLEGKRRKEMATRTSEFGEQVLVAEVERWKQDATHLRASLTELSSELSKTDAKCEVLSHALKSEKENSAKLQSSLDTATKELEEIRPAVKQLDQVQAKYEALKRTAQESISSSKRLHDADMRAHLDALRVLQASQLHDLKEAYEEKLEAAALWAQDLGAQLANQKEQDEREKRASVALANWFAFSAGLQKRENQRLGESLRLAKEDADATRQELDTKIIRLSARLNETSIHLDRLQREAVENANGSFRSVLEKIERDYETELDTLRQQMLEKDGEIADLTRLYDQEQGASQSLQETLDATLADLARSREQTLLVQNEYESRLAVASQNVSQLQAKMVDMERKLEQASKSSDHRVTELQVDLNSMQQQSVAQVERIAHFEIAIETLKSQLSQSQSAEADLKERMVSLQNKHSANLASVTQVHERELSRLEQEVQGLQKKLAQSVSVDSLSAAQTELQRANESLETLRARYTSEQQRLESESNELRARIQEQNGQIKSLEARMSQASVLETQCKDLSKEINSLQSSLTQAEKRRDDLESELSQLRSKHSASNERLLARVAELENDLSQAKQTSCSLGKQLEEKESRIRQLCAEKDTLQQSLKEAKMNLAEVEEELSQQREAAANQMEEHHLQVLASYQSQLSALTNKYDQEKEIVRALQQDKQVLEDSLQEKNRVLEALQEKQKKVESETTAKQAELEALQRDLERTEASVQEQCQDKQDEIENLVQSLRAAEEGRSEMQSNLEQTILRVRELENKVHEQETYCTSLLSSIQDKNKAIQHLEETVAFLRESTSEGTSRQAEELESLQTCLQRKEHEVARAQQALSDFKADSEAMEHAASARLEESKLQLEEERSRLAEVELELRDVRRARRELKEQLEDAQITVERLKKSNQFLTQDAEDARVQFRRERTRLIEQQEAKLLERDELIKELEKRLHNQREKESYLVSSLERSKRKWRDVKIMWETEKARLLQDVEETKANLTKLVLESFKVYQKEVEKARDLRSDAQQNGVLWEKAVSELKRALSRRDKYASALETEHEKTSLELHESKEKLHDFKQQVETLHAELLRVENKCALAEAQISALKELEQAKTLEKEEELRRLGDALGQALDEKQREASRTKTLAKELETRPTREQFLMLTEDVASAREHLAREKAKRVFASQVEEERRETHHASSQTDVESREPENHQMDASVMLEMQALREELGRKVVEVTNLKQSLDETSQALVQAEAVHPLERASKRDIIPKVDVAEEYDRLLLLPPQSSEGEEAPTSFPLVSSRVKELEEKLLAAKSEYEEVLMKFTTSKKDWSRRERFLHEEVAAWRAAAERDSHRLSLALEAMAEESRRVEILKHALLEEKGGDIEALAIQDAPPHSSVLDPKLDALLADMSETLQELNVTLEDEDEDHKEDEGQEQKDRQPVADNEMMQILPGQQEREPIVDEMMQMLRCESKDDPTEIEFPSIPSTGKEEIGLSCVARTLYFSFAMEHLVENMRKRKLLHAFEALKQ